MTLSKNDDLKFIQQQKQTSKLFFKDHCQRQIPNYGIVNYYVTRGLKIFIVNLHIQKLMQQPKPLAEAV